MRALHWIMRGMLCVVLLGPGACGKKGPPQPPRGPEPPAVSGLEARLEAGGVRLLGRVPPGATGPGRPRRGRLYHAHYAEGEAPCENCPLPLVLAGEISLGVDSSGRLTAWVEGPFQRGTHAFVLRLLGPRGAEGPPSDPARMTIP